MLLAGHETLPEYYDFFQEQKTTAYKKIVGIIDLECSLGLVQVICEILVVGYFLTLNL